MEPGTVVVRVLVLVTIVVVVVTCPVSRIVVVRELRDDQYYFPAKETHESLTYKNLLVSVYVDVPGMVFVTVVVWHSDAGA